MEKSRSSKLVKIHPGIQNACVLGAFFLSTGPLKDYHSTTSWKKMFLRLKSQVWTRQQQIQTWIDMSRKSPPPQKKLTNCTSLFLSLNKSLRNNQHLNSTSPFFFKQKHQQEGRGALPSPTFKNDKIWVRHAGDWRAHLRLDGGGLWHREGTAAVGAADGPTGRISGWLGGIGCSFWVCWCCVCFLLGAGIGGKLRMLMMNMTIDKDQIFWRLRVVWFLNNMFLKCL